MTSFIKKTLCMLAICLLTVSSSFAQEEVVGKDAPENFSWAPPTDDELGFRFISLDGKERQYYVMKGDFFAPVEMSGRNIGRLYSTKKVKTLVFYDRFPLEDPAFKGKARYVPALTVSTQDSSDLIIGIFTANGRLHGRGIDISLNKMPLGSFSVVNLNPSPMGFAVAKKPVRLSFFQSYTYVASTSKKYASVPFDIYEIKNSPPKLLESKKSNYRTNERTIAFAFNISEIKGSVGSFAGDLGLDNAPSSSIKQDILFLTDKGPR
jgi:hypothetical protein